MGEVMTALAGVLLKALPLAAGFTIALDDNASRFLNTLLNFIMIVYVAKLDARTRRHIEPKLEHIEKAADSVLDTRRPGGRRHHDPPHDHGREWDWPSE